MDGWLKQSTAITLRIGPFLDETNGKDAETELTVTQAEVRLSKAGGDFAQKNEATSLVHDELGYYICLLDDTDTNTLGMLKLAVHEAGALPVWHTWMVLPANVWDSFCSTDKLMVDCREFGDADLALTTQMKVDVNAEADSALTDYDAVIPDDLPTNFGDLSIVETTGLVDITQAAADKVWGTAARALTDKAGFGLADAAITAAKIDTDAITNAKIAADAIGASEFAQAAADKVWATAARALTDKADFALSAASRAAVWDEQEATLSVSFETLMYRIFTLASHKMNVTDADGSAALRNAADNADIATGSITDDDTTTVRAAWSWA